MAHPKRRQSNRRTAARRTHDVAKAPTAAQYTSIIQYVLSAVSTEASSQ